MRTCTNCKHQLRAEENFCPKCGTAAPSTVSEPLVATRPTNERYCTSCGSRVTEDVAFCPSCGKPLQTPAPQQQAPVQAFCVKCGHAFTSTETFCTSCGTARSTQPQTKPQATPSTIQPTNSSRAQNAMIIEIVAGIFGFLGVGYILNQRVSLGIGLLVGWWVGLFILVLLSVATGIFACLAVPIAIGVPVFSGIKLRDSILQQQ